MRTEGSHGANQFQKGPGVGSTDCDRVIVSSTSTQAPGTIVTEHPMRLRVLRAGQPPEVKALMPSFVILLQPSSERFLRVGHVPEDTEHSRLDGWYDITEARGKKGGDG